MAATNPYDELSGQRLEHGRGYEKRSVETFRARALDIIDELLRQVTELEDRLADSGRPVLSEAETDLLYAFRFADSLQRREALAALGHSMGVTQPLDGDERESVVETEGGHWLLGFGEAVAQPVEVSVDLRSPAAPEPAVRLPLRVAPVERSPRPPTPPTAWGGWVD